MKFLIKHIDQLGMAYTGNDNDRVFRWVTVPQDESEPTYECEARYDNEAEVEHPWPVWELRARVVSEDGVGTGWIDPGWTRVQDVEVVRTLNEMEERLVGKPTIPRDQRNDMAKQIEQWWHTKADEEIERTVPKAIEYGSHDLIMIGRELAKTAGREVNDEEAAELGVYFYLLGKMARWTDAVTRGARVSDDTLFDVGVYVRMAQRIRDTGSWPGQEG